VELPYSPFLLAAESSSPSSPSSPSPSSPSPEQAEHYLDGELVT